MNILFKRKTGKIYPVGKISAIQKIDEHTINTITYTDVEPFESYDEIDKKVNELTNTIFKNVVRKQEHAQHNNETIAFNADIWELIQKNLNDSDNKALSQSCTQANNGNITIPVHESNNLDTIYNKIKSMTPAFKELKQEEMDDDMESNVTVSINVLVLQNRDIILSKFWYYYFDKNEPYIQTAYNNKHDVSLDMSGSNLFESESDEKNLVKVSKFLSRFMFQDQTQRGSESSIFIMINGDPEDDETQIGEKGEEHNKKECTALLTALKERDMVSADKTIEFLKDWWKTTYAYGTINQMSPDGKAFVGNVAGGSKDTAKLYEKSKMLLARENAVKPKCTKTDEKIKYKSKTYTVHIGPNNQKFICMHGTYINMKQLV
jgi:hypothetical protein